MGAVWLTDVGVHSSLCLSLVLSFVTLVCLSVTRSSRLGNLTSAT